MMNILKEIKKTAVTVPVTHEPGSPIVEAIRLGVQYENHVALEDVSFQLKKGERVAVVGPNGAGKSTLFKVIAGIIPPATGEVKVYGHGPGGHICIAYVPQRSNVDWDFPVSVSDVVMMGRIGKIGLFRWPKKRDWEIVDQALETVNLMELKNNQISELSGGQQQRMFIARALAQESEIMLMDEPLNGLDVKSEEAIIAILDKLREKHVTIMLSTHDLEQAANHFDRIMLLNRELVSFGSPGEVFTPENLLYAYGGHMRLVKSDKNVYALTDSHCNDGEHS